MPDDPKPWYTSKTIWAGYVAVLLPALSVLSAQFHFVLPDQDVIVTDLAAVGTIIAAGTAIYGRFHAKAPIAKSTPTQGPTP